MKAINIDTTILPDIEEAYNGLTFMKLISKIKVDLTQNVEYLEDVNNYKNGHVFDDDYFKNRSYYHKAFFLLRYTMGLHNKYHYEDIKTLAKEINQSALSQVDKQQLKKRIRREFFEDYLSFFSWGKSMPQLHPPIPIFIRYPTEAKVEFKLLSETNFDDHYEWYRRELGQ